MLLNMADSRFSVFQVRLLHAGQFDRRSVTTGLLDRMPLPTVRTTFLLLKVAACIDSGIGIAVDSINATPWPIPL